MTQNGSFARNQKTLLIPLLVCLILIALLWAHASYYLPFISDDALISMRYSQRLIEGNGLTWTDGSQPVEGYSNLLWVLLTAFLGLIGFSLVDAVRVLGFFFMLVVPLAILFSTRYTLPGKLPFWPALVAGLTFISAGPVAIWTIGGLEQPLVVALLTLGLILCYPLVLKEEVNNHQIWLAGLSFALLSISRLDGMVFLAAILTAIILVRGFNRDSLRIVVLLAMLPLLFLLTQVAFRYFYYGEWVPNTALVKVSLSRLRLMEGIVYVWSGWKSLLPFSFLAILSGIISLSDAGQRRRIILLFLPAAVWLAYIAFVGGDIFPGWRHITPIIAIMALLIAEGVIWLGKHTQKPWVKGVFLAFFIICLAWYSLNQFQNDENQRAVEERWEWDGEVIGLMLKQGFGEKQPLMAVDPAGCLPFWSELPSLDMMGLNDYHIARNPPPDFGQGYLGHELGDGEYVLGREPDLVIFCLPTGSYNPCFRSGKEMLEIETFHEQYTPVIFEGRHPYLVQSIIWVRRFSTKIGIQQSLQHFEIPAYFFNGNPETMAFLDDDSDFVISIRPGGTARLNELIIPPGSWLIEASQENLLVSVSTSAGKKEIIADASLPAVFSQSHPGPRHLDFTLSSPEGEVILKMITLTRLTD